ncbi:MAG: response regulator [Vicinamibacterales bacterium]
MSTPAGPAWSAGRPTSPILIVEDDTDIRTMMAVLLETQGYAAVVASDGIEALSMARNLKPCLILLDLMMPVMDGPTFRHAQWQDPTISEIPVIILSAHPQASGIARELQAVSYLEKPVSFDALLQTVHNVCETLTKGRASDARDPQRLTSLVARQYQSS